MRIQFLNGGLANQAFQYIFAKYYEMSHPGDIMYMDDSYFAIDTVRNGYELEKVFGIKAHMLSSCFDSEVWNFILQERLGGKSIPQILCENGINIYMVSEVGDAHNTFNPFQGQVIHVPCNEYIPEVLDYPDDVYYHGYWINKKWFDKFQFSFQSEFRFPEVEDEKNLKYLAQIEEVPSVAIHIRRGDYVKLGWNMDIETYKRLIQQFQGMTSGKWELFVFSDDIEWCKRNQEQLGFRAFASVTFVEGNINGNNYLDLLLMSRCKAMIMSNSAFCYLAALLNTQKKFVLNPTTREV